MGWLRETFQSSIGKKSVMAMTGCVLGLFIAAHLTGNLHILQGRAALTSHAVRLQNLGWRLHLAELVLLLLFVLHAGFGLWLFLDNRQAKPTRYAVTSRNHRLMGGAPTMPYTGLFLLFFLAAHLACFRFGPSSPAGDLVATSLAQPATGIFYLIALLALTLHLRHGLWSLCQSLGMSHPKYDLLLEKGASAVGILLGALFMLIPLLALFWPSFLS